MKTDNDSLEQRIEENMGWIIQQAARYVERYPAIEMDDLIQQGMLAIVRANKKFDPNRGFKFLTYAIPWIRTFMTRWCKNNCKTVRVPENRWHGKDRFFTDEVSIYATLGGCEDDALTLADVLAVDDTAIDELDAADRFDALRGAVAELDAPRRRAIESIYFEGKSYAVVAAEEGVSRQAIQQRVQKAFNKLRRKPLLVKMDR